MRTSKWDDQNLMNTVIHKYYELGLSQEQIAKEEFISKSSVCRILKKAWEDGYISFQINYPSESLQRIATKFHEHFDLEKVYIAPTYTDDYAVRLREVCKPVLNDLIKFLTPADVISLSWGVTLETIAATSVTMTNSKRCAKLVLMDGYVSSDISSTHSSRILEQLCQFFSAEGVLLPAPLIVDTKAIANAIKSDSQIKRVLNMAKASNISLLSVGKIDTQSPAYHWMDAFSPEEKDRIVKNNAVGIIAGRFYDINGDEVCPDIGQRTISISLDDMKKKRMRMGIAIGADKVLSIIGALRGRIFNRFYTDERTALEIIKKVEQHKSIRA